jgi:DNA-binding GntR family transcriptional regulator
MPYPSDGPIQVQVSAIQAICGRLTSAHLEDLRRSVEQASLIPKQVGWDLKAAAHAEVFGVLAEAADHPALARLLRAGAGFAHQLMVTAGPASGMMTVSSRRRLLAHLAADDAAAAAAEMERHLRVLCFMGRLAGRP